MVKNIKREGTILTGALTVKRQKVTPFIWEIFASDRKFVGSEKNLGLAFEFYLIYFQHLCN